MQTAISSEAQWWQARYMDALERVKTPGELGELADVGKACIEPHSPGEVDVYVATEWGEESESFSPDEARNFAFELLVLADFAEEAGGK